jgi:DNA-binding transcriptional ArsR family regulator
VSDLCAMFDVSQPAVSQHLEVLRESGLVEATKVGRQRRYALDPAPLREIVEWAGRYERFWTERFDRLGRVLDREARAR